MKGAPTGGEMAKTRMWRKNTAGRWYRGRGDRASADLDSLCCRVNSNWTPLYTNIFLTLWRLTTHIGGRTAPQTSKRCILYIYSTNIGTKYFKHGIYTLRFFFPLQNAVCFIILTYLVPVLFTFYIQSVLKLKKNNNNSGAKRLIVCILNSDLRRTYSNFKCCLIRGVSVGVSYETHK